MSLAIVDYGIVIYGYAVGRFGSCAAVVGYLIDCFGGNRPLA